jgi:hypothetical protein
MPAAGELTVGGRDCSEALDLSKGRGKKFHTLGEIYDFVIQLVSDSSLLKQLDPELGFDPLAIEPHRWWFRGTRGDHDLDAKLFRINCRDAAYAPEVTDHRRLEQRIQHEYSLMTRGRFLGLSVDPWDRLFEMQHYGLPTRLLDWSFSLGQALWFALSERPERANAPKPGMSSNGNNRDDDAPILWILNPRLLAKASLGDPHLDDFPYLERYGNPDEVPWIKSSKGEPGSLLKFLSKHDSNGHFPVLASWTNPRMTAQMGCFTLQSGDEQKSPSLDQYAMSRKEKFLLKVRLDVDREQLEAAYRALGMIGINRYMVYPEIHETCAWLKELRFPR